MRLLRRMAAAALALGAMPAVAQPRQDAQALVDRATLAMQEMLTIGDPRHPRGHAAHAAPRPRRAGLPPHLPRRLLPGRRGRWLRPGWRATPPGPGPRRPSSAWRSGSIGLQIGVQDAQVLMLVMNDRGLTGHAGQPVQARRRCLGRAWPAWAAGLQGATTAAAAPNLSPSRDPRAVRRRWRWKARC